MEIIKLLLVEDDNDFRSVIKDCLEITGEYEIHEAQNGSEGFFAFMTLSFDIIVTDVDMPNVTGLDMVELIRKEDANIPILVASGLTNPATINEAFKRGIDNYIKKPYTSEELDCYIKVLLKRIKNNNQVLTEETKIFSLGSYLFDIENRYLKFKDNITSLSKRETLILLMLFKSKGKLVQRKEILSEFWGSDDDPYHARSLDVFIAKLRKYLHDDSSVDIITLRGEGLKLIC